MPRALLVSYHFPPSSSVGALRPARLARLLPSFGYQVDVVCAVPEHGEGGADPCRVLLVPEGARLERVDAPYVLGRNPFRIPPADAFFRGAWWKTRAYAEWLLLTRDWAWRWGEAAKIRIQRLLEEMRFDLVIADGPPFPCLVPPVRLAANLGIPVVLDLRDLWWPLGDRPSFLGPLSPPHRRVEWGRRLRDEAVQRAYQVVLTSQAMADSMAAAFPDLPASRFSCVTNAFESADSGELVPPPERPGRTRLVHTGSLAYGRADQAAALIRGIGEFRRRGGTEVELHLVGGGDPFLMRAARDAGVEGLVEMDGWVDSKRALELQRAADALLLLQPPDRPETRVAVPGKLFDYMARRRNVFALVGPGPAADIIRGHDLGVIVSSNDPQEIAEALGLLQKKVAERPVLPHPPVEFSERSTVEAFARILDGVLGLIPPEVQG